MKQRRFIMIIFAAIIFAPVTNYAETASLSQAKDTVKETGLKFAKCSGVYAAVSDVHAATDAPTLAKTTKETSNGAWLASAYLLFSTGIIPDWKNAMTYAENTASSEKLSYMASFEKYTDPNKALDELTNALQDCNKLGELQEKLVQEARLEAYSGSGQ